MPGDVPSTWSAADFTANRKGTAPTMSRVGSSAVGVRGSSDGMSNTLAAGALTKPWFEITVPSSALASTRTTKTIVAVSCGPGGVAATSIVPGGAPGVDSEMPFASGEVPPAPSGTGAPLSVVLPAMYAVFTGTASRSTASVASDVPRLRTVIVYCKRSPASSSVASPSMSAEILSMSKYGAGTTVTRVGSSSPATSGSDWPLTLGSSLSAIFAGAKRSAWFVTTVPLLILFASVMSNCTVAWLNAARSM